MTILFWRSASRVNDACKILHLDTPTARWDARCARLNASAVSAGALHEGGISDAKQKAFGRIDGTGGRGSPGVPPGHTRGTAAGERESAFLQHPGGRLVVPRP